MGLIIGITVVIVVVAVLAVAGMLGLLFKKSLKAGREDARASASLPQMSSDNAEKLSAARKSIVSTRQVAHRVQDEAIKQKTLDVLNQAENVLSSMRSQPEEVGCAKQFFGYYLPTLNTVLRTYSELESNDMLSEGQRSQTQAFLEDASLAFQSLFENMFSDEKLNLEVETEAMQAALRRDGLI